MKGPRNLQRRNLKCYTKSYLNARKCLHSYQLYYCDAYIPRSESGSLPKPLTSLFDEELIDASYSQLVDKSEETLRSIAISTEQAKSLELLTRGQSHSKLWYQYRAGRITASKFKNSVHTDVAHPSQSLIKRICYPESFKFKTQSTCWGLEREKQAIADYCVHIIKTVIHVLHLLKVGWS